MYVLSYLNFIQEAIVTDKPPRRPDYLTKKQQYESGEHFLKGSKLIGNIGGLELHAKENPGGGMTHFTRDPKSGLIHHVLTNVHTEHTPNGRKRLGFLTMHKRETSPVSGHEVYRHLVVHHGIDLKGTSHSRGAAKSWNKLAQHPSVKVYGEHPDGTKVELKASDIGTSATHVPSDSKSPVRKMALIATKRGD